VVAEGHRLSDLEVCEAGHYGVGMFLGSLDEDALQGADGVHRVVARIADPQFEIRRDLVVARPRRVKPPRRRADQLAEPVLDRHVDVLELDPLGDSIALKLLGDLVQALDNRRRVRFSYDSLLAKHRSMRLRRGDVLAPQALVEADGGIDALHQVGGFSAEPSAPHFLAVVRHGGASATQGRGGQTAKLRHCCARKSGTLTKMASLSGGA